MTAAALSPMVLPAFIQLSYEEQIRFREMLEAHTTTASNPPKKYLTAADYWTDPKNQEELMSRLSAGLSIAEIPQRS
ncbi:hypothetical protein [Nonlabens agnitus]|uniref:Uncharacterized protein n=1 Tax=Nonlabens agnitus TaxID=870484 RepID=A0A2S9WXE9_9FLAO|nr:hypothetical protein [Nonlabens agnitus]PRP68135.1 hypothetical protein BST86_14070 [Nonlabens agnitus]